MVWKISIYGKENSVPFCFVGHEAPLHGMHHSTLLPHSYRSSQVSIPGMGERSSACAKGRIVPRTLSQAHICLAPNLLSPGKTHGPTSCRPSARVHLR